MHRTPNARRTTTAAVLLLALGLATGGCALFSSDPEKVVVKESQLNWLEICYVPGAGQTPVKLSLMGSGLIRIKKGTSPLIGNDFSQDVASVKWNDINVDQINVQPSEMHGVFQAFVDRGVLREPDKDFVAAANRGVPVARITGTLGYEHVVRLAVEPELTGFVRDLLKLFDEGRAAPTPGR